MVEFYFFMYIKRRFEGFFFFNVYFERELGREGENPTRLIVDPDSGLDTMNYEIMT